MGILKDGQRNWFLGDAAREIGNQNLPAYASEIGVELARLEHYATVARSWATERRVKGVSWKVHEVLAYDRDLIRPGMTLTQAHRALGHSTQGRTGPRSSAQDRATQVKQALKDPEVAREVMADDDTAAVALQAHTRVSNERTARLDETRRADPGHAASKHASDWAAIAHELAKANVALSETVSRISTMSPTYQQRHELASEISSIESKLGYLDSVANNTEPRTLDEELTRLLG
jgi:hypothetical protein